MGQQQMIQKLFGAGPPGGSRQPKQAAESYDYQVQLCMRTLHLVKRTSRQLRGSHHFCQADADDDSYWTDEDNAEATGTPRHACSGRTSGASGRSRGSRAESQARSNSKGLRYFSEQVRSLVEQKQTTTYNTVASELVTELRNKAQRTGQQGFDEKNIKRRVYDAINVLSAIGIINKKPNKDVDWVGLPEAQGELAKELRERRRELLALHERKGQYLQDLLEQYYGITALLNRNKMQPFDDNTKLKLPFILVKAPPNALVNVKIAEDGTEVLFSFDQPFELLDEQHVLRSMGLQQPLDSEATSVGNSLAGGAFPDLEEATRLAPPPLSHSFPSYGAASLPTVGAPLTDLYSEALPPLPGSLLPGEGYPLGHAPPQGGQDDPPARGGFLPYDAPHLGGAALPEAQFMGYDAALAAGAYDPLAEQPLADPLPAVWGGMPLPEIDAVQLSGRLTVDPTLDFAAGPDFRGM